MDEDEYRRNMVLVMVVAIVLFIIIVYALKPGISKTEVNPIKTEIIKK